MSVSRKLKDWHKAYLEWTNEDEPAEIFRSASAISTIAACMQRKCFLTMGRTTFYPNFYMALVGPSGVRKSTAILPVEVMLTEIGVDLAASVTSKEKFLDSFYQIGQKDNSSLTEGSSKFCLDRPVAPHSSLTAIVDELILFLPQRDLDLVGYLLSLYDCKDAIKIDTFKRGERLIENAYFNLLGGITPVELTQSMTAEIIGAGLLGRFILVYHPRIGRYNAFPFETAEGKKLRTSLVQDLKEILMLSGPFKATGGYIERFLPWYETDENHKKFEGTVLEGYGQRRGSFVHKLSMVFSASRGDSLKVTEADFDHAMEWMNKVEAQMPKAIGGIGASEEGAQTEQVLNFLRSSGGEKIYFNTLLERFYRSIDDQTLKRILFTLEKLNKVKLSQRLIVGKEPPYNTEVIVRYQKEG